MKNKLFFSAIMIMLISFSGCSDFFEKDISNSVLKLISPADSLSSVMMTQTFSWEEVDGALKYNIQIVSPTFSSVSSFVIDSNLTETRIQLALQPGKYQWRVRALNGSSETNYTANTLTIDTTSDLSTQIILISSPTNQYYSNTLVNRLEWTSLYNASSYNLQIARNDFSIPTNLIIDSTVIQSYVNISTPQEGVYQFRVRGINSSGQTQFSSPVTFRVDITSPFSPGLLLPANNVVLTNPLSFYWDNGLDNGSPICDSIYIYSDSLATLVRRAGYPSTSNHIDSLGGGTYYWRVKSWDAAGNYSSFSTTRKFIIN